ncbi:MAG: von Willebrand factor type A domain-containing protein [Lachnospiraceae bacterium]|nr:von Willebrand factor type A domain-containing protein [Lachnospiraceae bacterium]
MKKKKKGIAIILLISMISAVSGCGGSEDSAGSTPSAPGYVEGYVSGPAIAPDYCDNIIYEPADINIYESEDCAFALLVEEIGQSDYYDSIYKYDTSVIFPHPNNEEYKHFDETGFKLVSQAPLSTFAADIDTASYANLRRLLNSGYGLNHLPEGSVRIEEMLNYFSYDFNKPKRNEPFGITTEISACPWNPDSELLMIGLATKDLDYSSAPPSNLIFLIDVSGSMSPDDRLPLLQRCFTMLAENLTARDKVSIVTYAGTDTTVLEGVSGNQRRKIKNAINGLSAGGSTNGSGGIIAAYNLAEKYFIEGGNNRIILATDGDLNVGITTEKGLEGLVTEKRDSGVFLSVLGVGSGNIKDNKMKSLALHGNGNYSFIDSEREGYKVLVEEMSATLVTVCKDVKFQVEFNPAVVKEYRLLGYENRRMDWQDFKDDKKDGGEIGAGHSVTVLYEIILHEPIERDNLLSSGITTSNLKYGANHESRSINRNNTGASKAYTNEWLTISVRYKKPAESVANELEYPVDFLSYHLNPGNDWKFAAAVAEFGLIASKSSFQGEASLANVRTALRNMSLDDEYKKEFLDLVNQVY